MKKIIFVVLFSIVSMECSHDKQTKNQQSPINNIKTMYEIDKFIFPDAIDITDKNFVEKLFSQIKVYNSEPVYYFRINKKNCLVEIGINEILNYGDYELSNIITPTKISQILKSGSQKVTVKMYPVGDLINEDLGLVNNPPETKLSDNSLVEIEIIVIDNKSNKQFADEKSVIKKVSPKEIAGKEFYEFSFYFDAEVPYEFVGWSKGQDLRKLDQDLVQKKALEFYEMVGEIHLSNDLNSMLKLAYPSSFRIQQALYKKNNLNALLEEYRDNVVDKYVKMPITNFKPSFMADGKLLRLITRNEDKNLRGGGALMLQYDEGEVFQPGITLFLPEGRDLATQGFMMWK